MNRRTIAGSGKVVYVALGRKGNAYVNPTNKCFTACRFCRKNALQKSVGAGLRFSREPSKRRFLSELKKNAEALRKAREIVFCGIGEPTLPFNRLVAAIKWTKQTLPDSKIRINTIGLAQWVYENRDVTKELKEAGLDKISVSLNALTAEDHNRVCPLAPPYRRLLQRRAQTPFEAVAEFVRRCVAQGIETHVSFVEFPGFKVSRKKAVEFAKKLGVDGKNVLIRKHIS